MSIIAEKEVIKEIHSLAATIKRDVNLMEVCGTHTQAVARAGLKSLMPKNVHLTTGPGCPVCVTAQEDIDAIVNLALAGIPVATYGDMLRVPGYYGSLDQARENGAKVFEVYSTEDALKMLKVHPDLVFFGLGFETTTPMSAYAIKKGLTVYSTHKLFLPAMKALLEIGELKIDGYICPGHVSAIIGVEPYKQIKAPQVITGFKPDDILVSIFLLLRQIAKNKPRIENEYVRAVKDEGNPKALKNIFEIFDITDGNWRGFGVIPGSGLEIKDEHKQFDAKVKYEKILSRVDFSKSKENMACSCGEIIRGLKEPRQCKLFGRICTPENPVGPCMVSVEGACNVAFRY